MDTGTNHTNSASNSHTSPFLLHIGKFLISLIMPIITFLILWGGFIFLRESGANQLIRTAVAIIWGIGGVIVLYWTAYWIVSQLPEKIQPKLEPYIFVGPALIGLTYFLFLPVLRSGYLSFFNADSTIFIGWKNFKYVFANRTMITAFRNNFLWIFFGTSASVICGFIIAYVADKSKWEGLAKSFIFMPMAISMVGASIIWKFVFALDPDIGLLNAIVTTFGGNENNWLTIRPWNNFFLIIVFIWGQTGFAMIVLSAAIKGVPNDLIEAANMDGANEFTLIFHIVIPYIKSTILTVTTAIAIASLKTFDIVFAMTNGLDGTEVLASQQYKQMFRYFHYGRGAAIALVILLLVFPIVVYNVLQFRKKGDI